jgi:hypothetical protein
VVVGDGVGFGVGAVVVVDAEIKHCQKSTVSIVIVSGVPTVHEVQIDEIAVPTTQRAVCEHTSGFPLRYL